MTAAPGSGGALAAAEAGHEFGTGLLHTRVRRGPDGTGWVWVRRPGPNAPSPFAELVTPPAGDTDDTRRALDSRARLLDGVPADGEPGARSYRVAEAESVAGRLLREGPDPDLVPALRATGALLRVLHGRPRETCPPGPARPVLRMRAWFAGRAPRVAAVRAGELLRSRIGNVRWTRLATWAAAAEPTAGGGPALALHGAPGLGSVVVDRETGEATLLGGEDAGIGPWRHDVGWMLGELVEMRWCAGGDHDRWAALAAAVVEGYGTDPGPGSHRWVALRVALHLHDFSAYVGWHPDELERYAPFLAALVDG